MAGPTPVSALIHAATMVTAGVYLVVRSSTLFAMAPTPSLVVALIGALTAIFAATIGLKQWDIKKVLAYSTVSQLGFMFAAVGMGAYVAGVFHLMTHAFFKACLFLGSGAVIHAMHEALHATHSPADAQDMRNMGGLRKYMPITFGPWAVATLAIAGVPPFSGFFSKDEIVGAAWIGAAGRARLSRRRAVRRLRGHVDGRDRGPPHARRADDRLLHGAADALHLLRPEPDGRRSGAPARGRLDDDVPLVALGLLSVIGGSSTSTSTSRS
jgi:small neutral amino acid transporter SnatA (MarC family)